MAFWSGGSRQAFAELKRVLAQLDPTGLLELVVVDTDGCSADLSEIPELAGRLHGWGETLWISRGSILAATYGSDDHVPMFESLARKLVQLRDPRD